MSTVPPPPPPSPGRRPFGVVRLTAPVITAHPGRPAALLAAGRWYGPRVPLQPLSIDTLRRPEVPS
ncbi:hypothetical protein HG542_26610 [Streptomyces morookaense]|uniref:Uncharacterized protein n=1 Tax=Streptomyces morookaense TaxID=1970 RepID=A0A7Y7B8W2_STRMO|nr:hypothetical protein [Streptomyces morookaense]